MRNSTAVASFRVDETHNLPFIRLIMKEGHYLIDVAPRQKKDEWTNALQSAIKMEQVAEPYIRRRAIRHLQKGRVVIFGAGTGNPYFTTDTAGSLRAVEIGADVILKGTRVDGVYTADPEKDPTAVKYDKISFQDCITKNLKVMDMTAFTLCMENKLPIIVFDMNRPGNLLKVVEGSSVGTLVS